MHKPLTMKEREQAVAAAEADRTGRWSPNHIKQLVLRYESLVRVLATELAVARHQERVSCVDAMRPEYPDAVLALTSRRVKVREVETPMIELLHELRIMAHTWKAGSIVQPVADPKDKMWEYGALVAKVCAEDLEEALDQLAAAAQITESVDGG